MVFKGLVKSFKEGRAEKKREKAELKKAFKDISKKAQAASLKAREKESIRIAKKEIELRGKRRERLLKEKFAKDPISLKSIAKAAFAPSKPVTKAPKKIVPRKSIDEELRSGLQ